MKKLLFLALLAGAALAGGPSDDQGHDRNSRKGGFGQHHRGDFKRGGLRDSLLAKLSPEQRQFVERVRPLRDSLHAAMMDYQRKAKDTSPRQLTAERAKILMLDQQINQLQQENSDVWLDLMAKPHPRPGFGGPRPEGGAVGDPHREGPPPMEEIHP